jgi:hypothetical protein
VSAIPYAALVLIEPMMISQELFYKYFDERMETMELIVTGTMARRDSWTSRDEAFRWMSKRFPWVMWDSRVVRILAV